MATKIAWLTRKRGFVVLAAVVMAVIAAKGGGHVTPDGLFDGG